MEVKVALSFTSASLLHLHLLAFTDLFASPYFLGHWTIPFPSPAPVFPDYSWTVKDQYSTPSFLLIPSFSWSSPSFTLFTLWLGKWNRCLISLGLTASPLSDCLFFRVSLSDSLLFFPVSHIQSSPNLMRSKPRGPCLNLSPYSQPSLTRLLALLNAPPRSKLSFLHTTDS